MRLLLFETDGMIQFREIQGLEFHSMIVPRLMCPKIWTTSLKEISELECFLDAPTFVTPVVEIFSRMVHVAEELHKSGEQAIHC